MVCEPSLGVNNVSGAVFAVLSLLDVLHHEFGMVIIVFVIVWHGYTKVFVIFGSVISAWLPLLAVLEASNVTVNNLLILLVELLCPLIR